MKSLNFNRDSWHYKVATELGGMPKWFNTTNICEYSRAVVKGVVAMLVILAVCFGALYWVADTLAWWAAVITTHVFPPAVGPVILTTAVSVFCLIEGVSWSFTKIADWLDDRRAKKHQQAYLEPRKPDSFVEKAWRSWMDKTCVRVTIN